MPNVQPIPEGYRTVTPYLSARNAASALDFYQRAFGAKEIMRLADPGGKVMHAEISLGDSKVMLAEESPEMGFLSPQAIGGSPVTIHVYVEDVDAFVDRAVEAGARITTPVENHFYGDRGGKVTDPFGHVWYVATHVEDVSPEEIQKRAAALFGGA